MDAVAESGRNPASKHQIEAECGESGLTLDGRPNPSHVTKFSGANGEREQFIFPCLADHEQDWQPYAVDPYFAERSDQTYYGLYIMVASGLSCRRS